MHSARLRRPLRPLILLLPALTTFAATLQAQVTREEVLDRPAAVLRENDLDGQPATLTAAEYRAWQRKKSDADFKDLDLNGDGKITQDEFWKAREEDVEDAVGAQFTEEVPSINARKFSSLYATTDKQFEKEIAKTWRDNHPWLKRLRVRQTLLQNDGFLAGPEADGTSAPARLSWTRDNVTSDDFFTFDGAVSYDFPLLQDRLVFSPTFEAHTSTQASNERDAITYALPFTWHSPLQYSSLITRHYLMGTASLNTDRGNNLETLNGALLYSLDIPKWGIGATLGKDEYPIFIMRPWIGLDHGSVNRSGGVPDLAAEKNFTRLRADLEATLWLTQSLTLNGRYVHHTHLNGLERSYNYGEVSAIMYLDNARAFSLGATYRRGKDAPSYVEVDSITVWTGLRF